MAWKINDELEETIHVSEQMVNDFAKVSGDFNAIHMDEEYAKKTRFGKRIAHGMISGALISRVLATKLGPGGIYLSQSMKFLAPVFIGDSVTVKLRVKHIKEEKGIATVESNVFNQKGEMVVKGESMIMAADKL
jgi:3-hydroxybutyryl-CoA dehydratase